MKSFLYGFTLFNLVCVTTACASTQYSAVEAPVVSVDPVVRTVTEKIPHETCWDERVRVERRGGQHAAAPSVVGAIIGGVTGGAIGRNSRHQPIIAGAGALLGAAIGHDSSHSSGVRHQYVTQQRCEIDYELRDKEQITGYRVGYRYGDTIYYTRMQHRPGPTITLNVAIDPVVRR